MSIKTHFDLLPVWYKESFKFIRVKSGDKTPLDSGWNTKLYFSWSDNRIREHVDKGGNLGSLPTGDLVVADADDPRFPNPDKLKDTTRVKTPSGGEHVIFRLNGIEKYLGGKLVLYLKGGSTANNTDHLGEIYFPPDESGKYAGQTVTPGSYRDDTQTNYEFINDCEPVTITADEFKEWFIDSTLNNINKPLNWKTVKKGAVKPTKTGKNLSDFLGLQMISILPPTMGKGSYRSGVEVCGAHPIHGSTGGHNWSVNLSENRVYCHRCRCGTSDPLQVVALAAGLIDCSGLGKTKIEGDLFRECVQWLENNGYKENIKKWRAERKSFEPPAPQKFLPGQVDPEKEDILVYLGTEKAATWEKQTYFVNSPDIGIYLGTAKYRQDGGPIIKRDNIASYHISSVKQFDNPADVHDTVFSLTLNTPGGGEKVTFSERSLDHITAGLLKRPGVCDRKRLPDAISAIFGEFQKLKLITREVKLPATGFFLDDGKIYWGESHAFPVKLPESYTADDIRAALSAIEEILMFYGKVTKTQEDTPEEIMGRLLSANLSHILPIFYWFIQAPLGFIRKQMGVENLYLLTFGQPHTGKTISCKHGAAIWGIDPDKGIVGAANLTSPQLAQHMNKTTLPICLDESRNILSDPRIAEMIKTSSTGTLIKERINSKAGFDTQEFRAYTSLVFTCNIVPNLYTGVKDRLLPVEYTAKHKYHDIEAVKKFETLIQKYRKPLSYLGGALRDMYTDPKYQDKIQRDLMENDPIKTGFIFLVALCKRHSIKPPNWLRETQIESDIEDIEIDPVNILYEYLADSYLDALRKISQSDYEVTDSGRYLKVSIPTSWEERLKMLKERNLFPSHTLDFSTQGNLILRNTLIKEIEAKNKCEIQGGVKGFVNRIPGSKYQPVPGKGRVLKIPVDGFIKYFKNLSDEQSTLET